MTGLIDVVCPHCGHVSVFILQDRASFAELERVLWKRMHKNLDSLVAAFIKETGRLLSQTTIIELLEWSYKKGETSPTVEGSGKR